MSVALVVKIYFKINMTYTFQYTTHILLLIVLSNLQRLH